MIRSRRNDDATPSGGSRCLGHKTEHESAAWERSAISTEEAAARSGHRRALPGWQEPNAGVGRKRGASGDKERMGGLSIPVRPKKKGSGRRSTTPSWEIVNNHPPPFTGDRFEGDGWKHKIQPCTFICICSISTPPAEMCSPRQSPLSRESSLYDSSQSTCIKAALFPCVHQPGRPPPAHADTHLLTSLLEEKERQHTGRKRPRGDTIRKGEPFSPSFRHGHTRPRETKSREDHPPGFLPVRETHYHPIPIPIHWVPA